MLSGRRPTCGHTVHSLWRTLRSQVPAGWGFLCDVAIPLDDANEFCPDLAVIPAAEVAGNRSAYSPELIELAVEVVSPSSVRNDYEVKDRAYAPAGHPALPDLRPVQAALRDAVEPGAGRIPRPGRHSLRQDHHRGDGHRHVYRGHVRAAGGPALRTRPGRLTSSVADGRPGRRTPPPRPPAGRTGGPAS
ncbi:Uma2 family endonuclease [Streptomyces sp. ISL-10]|uniref:Uma2 family endonuclease n=1 Tax=Streptomyces sp. ISL-10 TaxID=2819172 RepID=UPI0027E4C30A|nr:Uma2 family endonuclease [Streptomyces sp. ISL-10]